MLSLAQIKYEYKQSNATVRRDKLNIMAKEEKEIFEKDLTIREKIAIHLVILLVKIVKPFSWGNEFTETLKIITDLMNKKA